MNENMRFSKAADDKYSINDYRKYPPTQCKPDYKCITDIEELKKYLKNAPLVAFDFEMAPNDVYRAEEKAALDPAKAHIVGCSFSVAPGSGVYVPIKHLIGKNIDETVFMNYLKRFLTDESITKVAHNIAFESMFSYANGIVIQEPVYDTICAAQMTLCGNYKYRGLKECGLKYLVKDLLKKHIPTFSEVTEGKPFDERDAQDAETVRYGCRDSDYSLRLYSVFNDWFNKYLPKHRKIIEEIESPAAVYLGLMKFNGVPIDLDILEDKSREAEEKIEGIRQKISFIIGYGGYVGEN